MLLVNKADNPPVQHPDSNSAFMILYTVWYTMLNELSSHTRDFEYIVAYCEIRSAILEVVVQYLNSLPIPYANTLYPACEWTHMYNRNAIHFFYEPLNLLQPQVMATACTMLCH